MAKRRSKKSSKLSVYANLTHKRKTKKDAASRKRAEYLATLPKNPVKRLLYRLHPKRVIKYWFSKRGAFMALKIAGVSVLLFVLMIGGLFAYFRKDLDAIRPGELAKRVQTTVTKYYDRNGVLLWEDKGRGDYKLVVDGSEISDYMRQATIAIEDKDFYKHGGISVTGIARSLVSNSQGNSTQGGSTLTQQLVKQVFFPPDEAQKRGLDGIPRKIKEMILAIEVERMYNKEQILNLYLNESPYGGRRNGVESAAQTYFKKSSKNLDLAESALLAAIPNQPGLYNPYNAAGNAALIQRQHKVLDGMVELGYATKEQAEAAKNVPILDKLQPETAQFEGMKAPHFVLMVKSELEKELGQATVGKGGLTVKTTLDIRIQDKLEAAMKEMFDSSTDEYAGFTNGTSVVEDVKTGQIVALMGSRDYQYPGFGQDNAATAFIQPGSTVKPLVYAELFKDKGTGKLNYGSGSILADDHGMDKIYGAPLRNADGKYRGNINIRMSLALSRNVPAVKAMYISGVDKTLESIRAMGNTYYCTQGQEAQAGLASAIGGCGTRAIDLTNSYATLARMGTYMPTSSVIEVKNTQGQVLKAYKDESRQVIDPQIAYILSDILSDDNARSGLYGRNKYGLVVPGVKTAVKTGTSDKGGSAKDIWNASYSSALSMSVWLGNPDTRILKNGNSSLPALIIGRVMEYAHKEVYAKEGKWKSGDWFTQPSGIQRIKGELYPSWYNQKQSIANAKMTFDKVSKKKASDCTPDAAKIELGVTTLKDPITKKDVTTAPEGYDAENTDDAHSCDDAKPNISLSVSGDGKTITIDVSQGKFGLSSVEVKVGNTVLSTFNTDGRTTYTIDNTVESTSAFTASATVTDQGYYTDSDSKNWAPATTTSLKKTTGRKNNND